MSARSARTELRSPPRRHQRQPRRGEQRRKALLAGLGRLLQSRPLAKIGIADIAEAAGVTRSAFYFYFPTKAAAVAGLLEDIYDDLLDASGKWHGVEGPAQEELRTGFDAVVGYCRTHPQLMAATFDAVGSDAEVRELWEHWMDELATRVADKITGERNAGRAPAGADASALGAALVAMNERALEREARAIASGGKPSDALTEALLQAWQRTIYGAEG